MSFLRHQGIYCVALKTAGRKARNPELPVRPRNEFQQAIPQRVALQQSPPPLRWLRWTPKFRQLAKVDPAP
jgi:hypothetical protein